ncbi:hypothetical protein GCK72_018763 [Caenorhabditis remanei]|uniref:Uncharacterized protein n=1 Tax=Caenorhabditis remanei TaxID=31234 RepID=A0A6A5GCS6_CAERE|nr:hypothetical protein GCK72_018763 [Caenorhabditis remanei]KAF1752209.1 hypothetical protein GCK72_018763 [Caenorhabditis remanei]
MDIYDESGEVSRTMNEDVDETLDSILKKSETTMEQEGDLDMEEETEEIENGEADSPEDVDSPRASLQPTKKGKLKTRKRKRSSSDDSSINEPGLDAAQIVQGPLSNINKEINVGDAYQAKIEEDEEDPNYMEDREEPEVLVWECPNDNDKDKIFKFTNDASDRFLLPKDSILFILRQNDYSFDKALAEISKRRILQDSWTDEEIAIFDNSFPHCGKNFSQIRATVPHRSLTSVIKYYYNMKKSINYKQFANSKLNSSSGAEDEEGPSPYPEALFDMMCENCGEKAEDMQPTKKINRYECRACRIYYKMMGVPRPTSLRIVLTERIKNLVPCPEVYREAMKDYHRLSSTATGATFLNRKIGKRQTLEDILGVNTPAMFSKSKNERARFKKLAYRMSATLAKSGMSNTLKIMKDHHDSLKEYRTEPEETMPEVTELFTSTESSNSADALECKVEMVNSEIVMEHSSNIEMTSEESMKSSESLDANSEKPIEVSVNTTVEGQVVSDNTTEELASSADIIKGSSETTELISTATLAVYPEKLIEGTQAFAPVPITISNSPSESQNDTVESSVVSKEMSESVNDQKEEVNNPTEVTVHSSISNGVTNELSEVIFQSSKVPEKSANASLQASESSSDSAGSSSEGVRIWVRQRTVCMEEMEALADDSRRKMYDACQHYGSVNTKKVALWKSDMESLRNRLERKNYDLDLNPSFLFSKERVPYCQEWTETEKELALRCFSWYGNNFAQIADVLGTKTFDQVKLFHDANEKLVNNKHGEYEKSMKSLTKTINENRKTGKEE